MHCSGCSPFSKRAEASLRRPRAQRGAVDVRGRSRSRPRAARGVVSCCTSERAPPIRPAIEVGPSASSITTISPSSVRVWPSSVCTCSPSRARRTVSCAARHAVEVEGVQRLAGEQHRVVGDVDDVVDRPLAGRRQPRLQPRRRGRERDVLEHARGEAGAELGALDLHLGAGERAGAAGVLAPRLLGQRRRRWRRAARARRRRRRGSRAGWA